MKLRRLAIFTDLGRDRVGLTDGDVALSRRPRERLLVMAGACGLSASYKNDDREDQSRPSHPHEEGTL